MSEEKTQEKIQQLQLMEQSMQQKKKKKQQFQSQIIELDSALDELKDSKESYKIVGNIMVKSDSEDLKKDLTSKKEVVELRIKTLEKQEEKMREKSKKMQSEVVDKIKK